MEAYLTTDCADLLIFWKSLRVDILYSIHRNITTFMKFDSNAQDAFASKSLSFGVGKKGLILVVASVLFATACNEKSNEGNAESNDEEIRLKREEARRLAVGQQIARLETLKGDVYENVVIREVTPIGIEIRHDAGSRRVLFEQLPPEMQRQFHFDPKEKEQALRSEHAAQSARIQQVTTANTEKSKAQGSSQPNQNEEYQLKVSKAIATKSARIQVLEDEIRSLENDLYDEENKRYSRRYYSDGRWSYRAGGVSRAPIVREKLDEKRGELSILKQQVATLEVELESMR